MNAFEYASAASPDSARELLGANGRYLAGGIDLLGEMKEYIASPATLVNIKSVPGLAAIEPGEKSWTLGANVLLATIEDDPRLAQVFPALSQAAADVGSRQIRNLATLGGNLAQHSRCWYYRHRDILCLKKGGDTCYARRGENKYHSLFTGNTCISPVVSNLAVALGALEAAVVVRRAGEDLRMTIPELYAKAWENPTAHHSLQPGDLILRIEIPARRARSAYFQVSEKAAFDWALVSCAASALVEQGRLRQARIFLGAVANVPYQSESANRLLEGMPLDGALADKVAAELLRDAKAHSGNAYKIPLARALVRRALMRLIA